jgi:hypothetical protein
MRARRLTLAALVTLCALTGAFAFAGVSAQAAATHDLLFQFNEIPAGPGVTYPGLLKGSSTITVDSGHIWSAEHISGTGNFRIDEFNAANGQFMRELAKPERPEYQGIAVGHATGEGEIYVGEYNGSPGVAVFSESGALQANWTGADTPGGKFGEHEFPSVAVDGSGSLSDWAAGDVYVAAASEKVVDVFKPEAGGKEPAKVVTRLTGTCATPVACSGEEAFGEPSAVAVNSANGDVIVVDKNKKKTDLFEPTLLGEYVFVRTIVPPSATITLFPAAVNANDGEGDIYALGQVVENGQYMGKEIFEFSQTGVYRGRITAPAGAGANREMWSVAADPATHDVFVGFYDGPEPPGYIDVFGPNILTPDVTTTAASGLKATGTGQIEATLNGTVNPDKEREASCQFDWGTSRALGEVASCPAPVAEGESPVLVSAGIVLQPDTTYYYRLQATNKNGTNPGEAWQDEEFTTLGPGLDEEAVSAARAESVTFDAKLNPHGKPTSYYFQYGTTAAYGGDAPALTEAAKQGAAIGSGEGSVEVSQHVQGLSPATTYHYRVVAVSELASGEVEAFYGPDQTFTTQTVGSPLLLPDGRQWEMVSPPQKEGALLGQIAEGIVQASSLGNAFTDWTYFQPAEGKAAGADNNEVPIFFGRGATGWTSKVIAAPHNIPTGAELGSGQEYRFFSEDLSKGIIQPFEADFTPLSPEATESTAYLHTDYLNGNGGELCTAGCYQPLVSAANVPPGTQFGEETGEHGRCLFCGPYFIDGTPDLSHVVLSSNVALTRTPTEGYSALYEWSAGKLALVSLLPHGETNEQGGPVAALGGKVEGQIISKEGSRVIWLGQKGRLAELYHLYLTDTSIGGKGETLRLDLPQGGGLPEATAGPVPGAVSGDESRVFFRDESRLTEDSTTTNEEPDLYEYNLDAPSGSRLTDLTVDGNKGEHANVRIVVGASEDGSYVYFVATGVLSGQPNERGEKAAPGGLNLYVRHDGSTTFIGGLSKEDSTEFRARVSSSATDLSNLTARVSPNGRWLAFMSNSNLTGYDTTDAVSKHPDEEVYLYNATTNKLVCPGCNPSGARPVGVAYANSFLVAADRVLEPTTWVASNVPPWTRMKGSESRYQSRYLSNSGRLFFDSNDALVPQDVNGTQDVYEWEPAGVPEGSAHACSSATPGYSAASGGCVAPISSGTSNEESAFLDASETGGDVFFLTSARLVAQDFDNALDIYDAHECTTQVPCFAQAPVSPPPCTTGDSCKAAPAPQPSIFGAPPSATFSGAGNVAAAVPAPTVAPKALTRAQQFARVLRACRKKRDRTQRAGCERQARKRYAARRSRKASARKRGGR